MAHAGGRPLKFQSVVELDAAIQSYFDTEQGTEMPTITGLAVYLDTSRRTLLDYKEGNYDSEERGKFSHSVKRALAKCEVAVEQRALTGKANPTMAIFTLKNNYGWVDKTEQDITSKGESVAAKGVDTDILSQFMLQAKQNTKQ